MSGSGKSGSWQPPQPRSPASPTVFDTDAVGPENISLYPCASSISLVTPVGEFSNLPTTMPAHPLYPPGISTAAGREDTCLRRAWFASSWTSSSVRTSARPCLKARMWYSPHCSKRGSTDQTKRAGARQARGRVVLGSKRSPQPRSPALSTGFDTDAGGPEEIRLYPCASSISLVTPVGEFSNLPTTMSAPPLFPPSTSNSASREDTRLRRAWFASSWTSSSARTTARPCLEDRLWY